MVRVKTNSKIISRRQGRGRNARDSYYITLVYTPVDIKSFLQEYIKELRQYDMPNKFTERELIELFATRVFSAIPEKHATELAEWGFDICIKKNYITSNRWNKDEPTIYFIDKAEMSIRRGRAYKRKVETYEDDEK